MNKPPPPPKLDADRARAAVVPLTALLRQAVWYLVQGEPDSHSDAGCRLIGMALMDIWRGHRRRDNGYIEAQVRFLNEYIPLIPARLRALRTPGAWAERGPLGLDGFHQEKK